MIRITILDFIIEVYNSDSDTYKYFTPADKLSLVNHLKSKGDANYELVFISQLGSHCKYYLNNILYFKSLIPDAQYINLGIEDLYRIVMRIPHKYLKLYMEEY